MNSLTRIVPLFLCVALCGCAMTLHGEQSASGGAVRATTASSVSVNTGSAHARLSGSFGSAPAPGAGGGQISASRGGSLLVLLGVIIADLFARAGDAPNVSAAPGERISETCSCYGWKPGFEATNKK